MSKKLDKLKEVNSTINELLIKLETYVFVEDITINYGTKRIEHLAELK